MRLFLYVYILLICCNANADWQLKEDKWLGSHFLSLLQLTEDGRAGIYLTSSNIDAILVKLVLAESDLPRKNEKSVHKLKINMLFDNVKPIEFTLFSDLNIHRLDGVIYELPVDAFDADFYEYLKQSSSLKITFNGFKDQPQTISIPLTNYFVSFNRYLTQRMLEFVPYFKTSSERINYVNMTKECVQFAEDKVDDLIALNLGESISARQDYVIAEQLKLADLTLDEKQKLSDRVVQAYNFSGDKSQPEWVLYQLFTECYNKSVVSYMK